MQQPPPPPPPNPGQQPPQPPFVPRGPVHQHQIHPHVHHHHTVHGHHGGGPPTVSAATGVVVSQGAPGPPGHPGGQPQQQQAGGQPGQPGQPLPSSVVTSGQQQHPPKVHVLYFQDPNSGANAAPVYIHGTPNVVMNLYFFVKLDLPKSEGFFS